MKALVTLLFAIPTLLFSQTVHISKVENQSTIQKIEDRDVTFGVKEEVEELLSNIEYNITDSEGYALEVFITKIESPQQILNILGTKWLKKSYVVETKYKLRGVYYTSVGKRNTFLFAAFLDVENNEVPLNRKAFSKALQAALKDCTKQIK